MDKNTIQYWKKNLKESLFAIFVLSLLSGAGIYAIFFDNSKVVSSEIVTGELVSFHQIQGQNGAIDSVFIVKLSSGGTARVSPPSHTPIRINHEVELEKRVKESGRIEYIFKRYPGGR
jgi:hypothetical protein